MHSTLVFGLVARIPLSTGGLAAGSPTPSRSPVATGAPTSSARPSATTSSTHPSPEPALIASPAAVAPPPATAPAAAAQTLKRGSQGGLALLENPTSRLLNAVSATCNHVAVLK